MLIVSIVVLKLFCSNPDTS